MSEISKEEMMMFLDVHAKSVAQMQSVVTQLNSIAETNKTIVESLTSDEGVSASLKTVNVICTNIKSDTSKMKNDIFTSKVILGVVSLTVIVTVVILKFIDYATEGSLNKHKSRQVVHEQINDKAS